MIKRHLGLGPARAANAAGRGNRDEKFSEWAFHGELPTSQSFLHQTGRVFNRATLFEKWFYLDLYPGTRLRPKNAGSLSVFSFYISWKNPSQQKILPAYWS